MQYQIEFIGTKRTLAGEKRIYSVHDEREASRFAHVFGGIHYEYLPGIYRVII